MSSLASFGAAGAVAAILLAAGLYTFKKLFDRVLDKNDKAVDVALQKLDGINTTLVQLREDVVRELADLRHDLAMFVPGRVAESAERDQASKRR